MYNEDGYKEGSYSSPPKQRRRRETNVKWSPISWWKFNKWAGYFTLRNFTKDECVELSNWCVVRDFQDWQFADSTGDFDAMSKIDIHSEEVEEIFNGNLRLYFKNKNDATMFRFTWGG